MKKSKVLILMLALILAFSSCDKWTLDDDGDLDINGGEPEKVVVVNDGELYGTIEYVSECSKGLDTPRYFVYVAPLGDESDVWIPFIVDGSTEILKVGNTVKITYFGTDLDGTMRRDGFVAESISLTDATRAEGNKNPLAIGSDYVLDRAEAVMTTDFGTVVHVARVETGASGYLVYLDGAYYDIGNLVCYWVDDNAIFTEEALDHLSKGMTGYQLKISGVANSPYENIDIEAAVSVSIK